MATAVGNVDVYEANNWIGSGFLRSGSIAAPTAETSNVQNHSWIYFASAAELTTMTDVLRRSDYSINTNNYVTCVGMDNNASTGVPILMATAANVISVGLTSGAHSRGLTDSTYDLPGRSKPEIVAPLDFTSFATGLVSGAAATLRSAATTAAAQRNETLRAVMLAGATKAEFPNWSRATTHPLDPIYGAGELNVQHSYHILAGGKQTSSSTVPVALQAWDYRTYSANTNYDYLLQIPANLQGASLSAVVVWNRTITRSGANYTPATLPNLTLTLYKGTANPGAQIDVSASTGNNLEHIWQPALTCGTYRLRLSGDLSANAAIAWRVTPASSEPMLASSGVTVDNTLTFQMMNLVPAQMYQLQASPDLVTWTTLNAFTANVTASTWTAAGVANTRTFYRLQWTCP
jgi:hypothetical protein